MYGTVGYEADEVQAAGILQQRLPWRQFCISASVYRIRDSNQVLFEHAAGAEIGATATETGALGQRSPGPSGA